MNERAAKLFGGILAVLGTVFMGLFGWLAFKEPPITVLSLLPCAGGLLLLLLGCLAYPNTMVAPAIHVIVVTVSSVLPSWGRRSTDKPDGGA